MKIFGLNLKFKDFVFLIAFTFFFGFRVCSAAMTFDIASPQLISTDVTPTCDTGDIFTWYNSDTKVGSLPCDSSNTFTLPVSTVLHCARVLD